MIEGFLVAKFIRSDIKIEDITGYKIGPFSYEVEGDPVEFGLYFDEDENSFKEFNEHKYMISYTSCMSNYSDILYKNIKKGYIYDARNIEIYLDINNKAEDSSKYIVPIYFSVRNMKTEEEIILYNKTTIKEFDKFALRYT